jgi:hypothetical protein
MRTLVDFDENGMRHAMNALLIEFGNEIDPRIPVSFHALTVPDLAQKRKPFWCTDTLDRTRDNVLTEQWTPPALRIASTRATQIALFSDLRSRAPAESMNTRMTPWANHIHPVVFLVHTARFWRGFLGRVFGVQCLS